MLQRKLFNLLLLLGLLVFFNAGHAEGEYFLCGPDEDGCPMDQVQYCACIPYDEIYYQKPYCLDFDNMKCEPLEKVPNCAASLIFKDQGRCLATIYQSEPEPPCETTSKTFCLQNHAWFCDVNGDPHTCKKG